MHMYIYMYRDKSMVGYTPNTNIPVLLPTVCLLYVYVDVGGWRDDELCKIRIY